MRQHANVWVIRPRIGCGQQDQTRGATTGGVRFCNEFPADAQLLKFDIDRQIREICAITKICNRTTHANQLSVRSSRHDQVCIAEHQFYTIAIIHRATFCQRRSLQDTDKLSGRQFWFKLVFNAHENLKQCLMMYAKGMKLKMIPVRVSHVHGLTQPNVLLTLRREAGCDKPDSYVPPAVKR